MTSSAEFSVSEKNLTCPICLEIYNKPKTVTPCLHTFCEACLKGILSNIGRRVLSFPCPVCRKHISAPEGARGTPDSWAQHFPASHYIQSLLDDRKQAKLNAFMHPAGQSNTSVENPPETTTVSAENVLGISQDQRSQAEGGDQSHAQQHEVEDSATDLDQDTLELLSNTNPAGNKNPVSVLMEYSQLVRKQAVFTQVEQSGASHQPTFVMAASLGERRFPAATGLNKADAKKKAACVALNILKRENQLQLRLMLQKCNVNSQSTVPVVQPGTSTDQPAVTVTVPVSQDSDMPDLIPPGKNPASCLNEYAQQRGLCVKYDVLSQSGPPHNPRFEMCAFVGYKQYPSVTVQSKKEGKTLAAMEALRALKSRPATQQTQTRYVSPPSQSSHSVVQDLSEQSVSHLHGLDATLLEWLEGQRNPGAAQELTPRSEDDHDHSDAPVLEMSDRVAHLDIGEELATSLNVYGEESP